MSAASMNTKLEYQCPHCWHRATEKSNGLSVDTNKGKRPVCPRCGAVMQCIRGEMEIDDVDNMPVL